MRRKTWTKKLLAGTSWIIFPGLAIAQVPGTTSDQVTPVADAAPAQTAAAAEPSAPAQSTPQDATGGGDIVVTGSRLPSTSLSSPAPVTVLNEQQIKATGSTNVGELLRTLPAATGTSGETAGRGNNGAATVALRGLSAVNTLVLINGRRVLASSGGGTVDLNSIPFDAIERVEVLQDGASAIYGSDAIAGVVNLIMRKSANDLMVRGYYGIADRGDVPTRELSMRFGHDFDRGSFVITADYRAQSGNLMADRPVSNDPDERSRGGANLRNPLPPVGAFTNIVPGSPSTELILKEGVTQAHSINDFRPFIFPGTGSPLASGNDGINFFQYTTAVSDSQTANVFFNGTYDLTDNIQSLAEVSFNHRHSFGHLTPDSIGAVFGLPVTIAADNIYNPLGYAVSVNRTLTEETTRNDRQNDLTADTYRVVLGLKGSLSHSWDWDVSYNYQHLSQYDFLGRGVIYSKIKEAAGGPATCNFAVDGCVPINLFGAVGTVTPDMLNFITQDSSSYGTSSLKSAVANLSGSLFRLPAGDVNVAIGAEYREETYTMDYDTASEQNLFVSRTLSPDAFPPTRKIAEVYGEIGIPLLRNLPLIDSLDVEGAVRYSHYNAFGGTTNPKASVKWRPFHDLLVRGTWGTGFRAPTFTEAYGGQTNGFQAIVDPCLSSSYVNYPNCGGKQATTVSTGAYVLSGGNPNLKPETAKNLTVGAVYTPRFAPGLALTVDYFHIQKNNIIGSPSVNYVIAQNALNGSFADDVVREQPTNDITQVIAVRENLLNQDIRGIDAELLYATPMHSWGRLSVQGALTYLDSYKLSPAPGVAEVEDVGSYEQAYGTLARFRGNALLTYTKGNLAVSYNGRFVGAVVNDDSLLVNGQHLRTSDYIQHDLQFAYTIKPHMTWTVGVHNLLDEWPPFIEGDFNAGYDSSTFNSIGRFFYTSIELHL